HGKRFTRSIHGSNDDDARRECSHYTSKFKRINLSHGFHSLRSLRREFLLHCLSSWCVCRRRTHHMLSNLEQRNSLSLWRSTSEGAPRGQHPGNSYCRPMNRLPGPFGGRNPGGTFQQRFRSVVHTAI